MAGTPSVRVGRIYDEASDDDGFRVLVDRIWPRGVSKEKARLGEWCKAVAPSTELRKWYDHDPAKFREFGRRYADELGIGEQAEAMAHLRELAATGDVTLLTASKAMEISQATVLAALLTDRLAELLSAPTEPSAGSSGD